MKPRSDSEHTSMQYLETSFHSHTPLTFDDALYSQ